MAKLMLWLLGRRTNVPMWVRLWGVPIQSDPFGAWAPPNAPGVALGKPCIDQFGHHAAVDCILDIWAPGVQEMLWLPRT